MADRTISQNMAKGLLIGMHDAKIGDDIVRDIPTKMVFVTAQSELANFTDEPVGTIAATYGFGSIWQLKPDRTWASM